ncbi:MAG: nucleotidyltransferase domain-containing protein [Candidatus Omnitrophota bacterium]
MISAKLKKQILDKIFQYILRDDCLVFLFGSFGKGNVYRSSDIDIGILSSRPLENSIIVKIKEEMSQVKTLRDIDLVDFLSVQDNDFLRIALKEIKIWHKTSRSKVYLDNLKKRIRD